MQLILTQHVAKHEFAPLKRHFTLDDILNGARKAVDGLGIHIKAPQKLENCRFFKIRIGGNVAGRMIVLIILNKQNAVPLLIRLKKDKIFGMNMSMNNQSVIKELNKNLDKVLDDIRNNRYEKFAL